MDKSKLIDLDPPRFENGERLCIAGFGAQYSFEASEGIPDQWRRFGPHIGHVPGQSAPEAYGVSFNFDDAGTFAYVAGVRVRDFSETPGEFATLVIEPRRYVVFKHNGHVIGLHRSHYTILNDWRRRMNSQLRRRRISCDSSTGSRGGKRFEGRL